MPELPEVETIRRQLGEVLVGKEIEAIEVLRSKSFEGNTKELVGKVIKGVSRKAKIMVVSFGEWEKCLMIHLKMTGQLIFWGKSRKIVGGHPTLDWVNELPSSHTRVVITFAGGDKLYFNDMRVFGWIRLVTNKFAQTVFENLPPDVTDAKFSERYLREKLKSTKAVKLIIMDQEKIGGIGNIYANDALFLAGIRPNRPGKSLTKVETGKLYKAVRRVINLGIKLGGASASNYFDINGMGGSYQDHFLVYKRDGEKCEECGNMIKKMRLGGRGTFYCEVCQV